jgi:predicted lipoprotein with Yx(FWY)xxD motif
MNSISLTGARRAATRRGGLAAVCLIALALTACSSGGAGSSGSGPYDSGSSSSPSATSSPTKSADQSGAYALGTADTALGKVVVDSKGMTVYVFDKDTQNSGKSVCEGDCLVKWPAVTATGDSPKVNGVTGTVGTITRTDGSKQVTLNGWPLYLYAGDSAAGDVTGQAVGSVWWAVAPNGDKITATK